MGPGAPILEARSVNKAFGNVVALDNVDLSITAGEWIAIVGPSGSGKSTLLQLLGSLETPDEGSILYKGTELTNLNLNSYRRQSIGMVYQLHNLLPHLDVAGNVEVALYGSHRRGRSRATRVTELLDELALMEMHNRKPPELSGGERQRVAIARAICNWPEVLLADEPTGSLDPQSVRHLVSFFAKMKAERNMSIVMVTHDREVAHMADRVLVLEDGRLGRGTAKVTARGLSEEGSVEVPVPYGWDAFVP